MLACLLLTTSSCSLLQEAAVGALTGASKSGVEANANIAKGDAEGEDSVAQNANTAVSIGANKETAQSFAAPVDQVVNESGLKWWELGLIVLLAGWAIPSPAEMLSGLVRVVRGQSH